MSANSLSIETVMAQFIGCERLTNRQLFEQLVLDLAIPASEVNERATVDGSGKLYNLFERRVRWHQQTLKRLGVLERIDRGTWRLSKEAKDRLTPAPRKVVLLAFSTDLGEQITLAFTSPPYPLAKQRAYGNADQARYMDWLLPILEPIVAHLRPGGNLVLNLGNDIFEPGSPARSLYLERLTVAMHDQLGLHLMERFVWHNPTKPPGPVQWASIKRVQLNTAYEHVLWFTNAPDLVLADNRRCLVEHTAEHRRFVETGGVHRYARYAGGSHTVDEGSYSAVTAGAIARNVLTIVHRDPDQQPARDFAAVNGLPLHPALMPVKLAEHFVRFLSEVGDLVVDPFGGWATTGRGAELHGRRWMVTERCREYLIAAAQRFHGDAGFQANF